MSEPKLLSNCPKCGEENLSIRWSSKGRMQEQYCLHEEYEKDDDGYEYYVDCGWVGEPYIPAKEPVKTVKTICVGCWCYELFDGRGQTLVSSQGFSSEKLATEEAKKEVARYSLMSDYGKCKAVVWPPTTKVHGKLIK